MDAGARIQSAFAEDGEGVIVVHTAPDAETSTIVESIERTFTGAELLAQREVDRPIQTSREFRETVKDQLTDKQRTALEAAYRGGYFTRPRSITGGELAESFDVTPSTYHHHLQAGLNKVVGAVFDDAD
jgi:predicted DNA binding protein